MHVLEKVKTNKQNLINWKEKNIKCIGYYLDCEKIKEAQCIVKKYVKL